MSCQQKDVRFFCIKCLIDFSGLIIIPNYGPLTLCIGSYLKLPQKTAGMTDGNNVTYYLTSWHGATNLLMLTSEQVCMLILEPCLQDGPIALCPTNFNLDNTNINQSRSVKQSM
jgi:hypothetical protein